MKTTSNQPLVISNLSKSFAKKLVLKDLSLSLIEGEVFGLIGLNGIGKTTLIKTILDLLKPDSGEIEIFGIPSHQTNSRRNLSYLPEKFQPSKYLKGHEYLELSMSFFGEKYSKEDGRIEAEKLALDPDSLDKLVGSYSKGMGQKLGLLGAMMVKSPLLILDEPMSGLDPRARIMLKERLLKEKKSGKTLFFSSHILADIDEICDRIGVLHGGELFFVGKPSDFRKQYGDGELSLEHSFLQSIDQKDAA